VNGVLQERIASDSLLGTATQKMCIQQCFFIGYYRLFHFHIIYISRLSGQDVAPFYSSVEVAIGSMSLHSSLFFINAEQHLVSFNNTNIDVFF